MDKPRYSYCTLDQLGSVARGKSKHRPRNDPALYGGSYPFIQTGDVKHSQFYITEYTQTYNELGLAQSKLWPSDTLCITIAANIADSAILTFPACFPDSIIGFIADPRKSDLRFVKYCLDTYKKQMEAISKGTTQDNLSLDKLLTIKMLVPSLSTQKKIASILSAYDDLIENNKRRIAILEKMAEEIYREWFVRMRFSSYASDFAKATSDEMATEGSSSGRNTDTQTVDNDSLSRLGKVARLKDIATFYKGKNPESTSAEQNEDWLPYITVEALESDQQLFAKRKNNSVVAQYNEILMLMDGARSGLVFRSPGGIVGSTFAVLRTHSLLINFLFEFLKATQTSIVSNNTGSAIPHANKEFIHRMQIALPDASTLQAFNAIYEPIDRLKANLKRQNDSLTRTRDLLLPRLISGKLSVENLDLPSTESARTISSARAQAELAHA